MTLRGPTLINYDTLSYVGLCVVFCYTVVNSFFFVSVCLSPCVLLTWNKRIDLLIDWVKLRTVVHCMTKQKVQKN